MKKQTNVQFIKKLMEQGRHGPLNQAFVMCAIKRYVEQVLASTPEQLNTGLISGELWLSIADEIKKQFDKHNA